jgi:cytochrome c553
VAEPAAPIAEEAARNLANNCFTCHGPAGRSPGSIPSLYTLGADDIAKRLRDFKNGVVPSTVMGRHAKGYSDAEIEAVARYIAGLKN